MNETPKYALEYLEFTEPVVDAFEHMEELAAKLKARGYEFEFATLASRTDGIAEALIVVGTLMTAAATRK